MTPLRPFLAIAVLFLATVVRDVRTKQYSCYECNSGPEHALNSYCKVNGGINNELAAKIPCRHPCFSKTSEYEPGGKFLPVITISYSAQDAFLVNGALWEIVITVIYRGCSTGMVSSDSYPDRGCSKRGNEIWCFCSYNLCNKRNMAKLLRMANSQTKTL